MNNITEKVLHAIHEADEYFRPEYKLVETKTNILKQYCDAIDRVIINNDGLFLKCSIDDAGKLVHTYFLLESLTVNNPKNDLFQELVRRSVYFDVKHHDDDHIMIHLVFPSVWERSNAVE